MTQRETTVVVTFGTAERGTPSLLQVHSSLHQTKQSNIIVSLSRSSMSLLYRSNETEMFDIVKLIFYHRYVKKHHTAYFKAGGCKCRCYYIVMTRRHAADDVRRR